MQWLNMLYTIYNSFMIYEEFSQHIQNMCHIFLSWYLNVVTCQNSYTVSDSHNMASNFYMVDKITLK